MTVSMTVCKTCGSPVVWSGDIQKENVRKAVFSCCQRFWAVPLIHRIFQPRKKYLPHHTLLKFNLYLPSYWFVCRKCNLPPRRFNLLMNCLLHAAMCKRFLPLSMYLHNGQTFASKLLFFLQNLCFALFKAAAWQFLIWKKYKHLYWRT